MKIYNQIENKNELDFTGERLVPDKTPYAIAQAHIGRYIFASKFIKNKIVLDIACGTGYGSNHLAKEGANCVFGGDISSDSIEYAKNKYKRENLNFACTNAIKLPFDENFFDVIISYETIEHIQQYEDFLSECGRVLKRNGIFICSTPNKKIFSPNSKFTSNPYHVIEFYPKEFTELLNKFFVNVDLFGQENTNIFKRKILGYGTSFLKAFPFGKVVKNLILKYNNQKREDFDFKFGEDLITVFDDNYKISDFQDNIVVSAYIIASCKGVRK